MSTGAGGMPEKVAGEDLVIVRRQWNDYRAAVYRRADVEGAHWSDVSGGINAQLPQYFLHVYVLCDGMVSGEVAHSCEHGEGPHRIKVCVLKKDNPRLFDELRKPAGAKPYIEPWHRCQALKPDGTTCDFKTREHIDREGWRRWACKKHRVMIDCRRGAA